MFALWPPVRPKASSAFEPEFVAGLRQYAAEHTAASGDAILAGGVLARVRDFIRELYGHTPWMLLLIVGGVYLLLCWPMKTPILSLKAALMNFLPILASFGLLSLVFQEGWLRAGLHTPY